MHNQPPASALEREELEMSEQNKNLPATYIMHEIEKGVFDYPFPLSEESQIKLLQLVGKRRSGIIATSELKDILFPKRTVN